MNRHNGFLMSLVRWMGIGYDEAANQDARGRIAAFFGKHLAG
jgi:dienelactone hydrolase